jgi:hypothetical protein
MKIFPQPGLIAYQADNPVLLTIEGFRDEQGLYLETLKGDVAPNYQLTYAVGNSAFLNSFHQRLGVFSFSGIYSNLDCSQFTSNRSRVRRPPFFTFYLKNNINTRTSPVRIVFSGIVMLGFIVRLNIGGARRTDAIEGAAYSFQYLGAFQDDAAGLLAPSPEFTPGGSGSGTGGDTPKQHIDDIFRENGWTSPVNAGLADSNGNVVRPPGLATTGGTF